MRQKLFAFGALLGGVLFVWQVVQAVGALMQTGFSILHAEWIVVGVGCVLLVTLLQIAAWKAIMRSLGVHLNWSASIRGYMLPFVSRYIPGMVWGYLSRAHWMSERHQVAARIVNVGAVIEVLAFVVSAALVGGAAGALGQEGLIALLGFVSAALVLGGVLLAGPLAQSANWANRLGRVLKIDGWIREITLQRIATALPWHVGMWLGHGLITGCLLLAISGWDGRFVPIVVASFPLAWLGGFVVVVLPAGLGLREFGLVLLLTHYAGISQPDAATVAVMSRIVVLLGEVSFLLIALVLEHQAGSHKPRALRDQDV